MSKKKKAAVGTCIRLTDTTWRLQVSNGFDANGKRIRPSMTVEAKDEREARRKLASFVAQVENGLYLEPSKMSFKDFSEKWLKDYAEKQLAPKTVWRYRQMLDSRIIPAIGNLKLEKITPLKLIEFYNFIQEPHKFVAKPTKRSSNESELDESNDVKLAESPGLSDRTILHHHRLIHKMFESAVQWQLMLSNPAARVDPPKAKKKEAPHFDEDQTNILISALEDESIEFKTIVLLTLFCGLREGELMGLEWSDIDFEKCTLEVNRASQYVPGLGTFVKNPKNESSSRKISIPGSIVDLLKQYKVWQNERRLRIGSKWVYKLEVDGKEVDNNRIFTQWNGAPMFPTTPTKLFSQFIIRYNAKIQNDESLQEEEKRKYLLPKVNFHGLRHTNATLLIAQGVNIKTISSRLGHSTVSTTTDIYSHSLRSADIDAAARLENALMKKPAPIPNKVNA